VATITMVPLGAVFSAAGLVYLGGRWAGRHSAVASLRDVARGGAALAATYGFVVLIAAGVARGGEVNAGVVRPTLAALALGLAVGGAGILRGAGLTHRLLARLPVRVRAAAAGALAGVAVMLVAGALLVAGSLVAHFSLAVNLAEDLHTGIVGGILVALIGVAVLPNAVLCAGAFAAGPGFAVGVGTAVAPGGVTLGALPVFPLLAAVPHDADARWLQALVLVPVIAGVAAGLTAIRRCPAARWDTASLMGGLAGLLGGLVFGVLCELASGWPCVSWPEPWAVRSRPVARPSSEVFDNLDLPAPRRLKIQSRKIESRRALWLPELGLSGKRTSALLSRRTHSLEQGARPCQKSVHRHRATATSAASHGSTPAGTRTTGRACSSTR
jgi:hypothetical protein